MPVSTQDWQEHLSWVLSLLEQNGLGIKDVAEMRSTSQPWFFPRIATVSSPFESYSACGAPLTGLIEAPAPEIEKQTTTEPITGANLMLEYLQEHKKVLSGPVREEDGTIKYKVRCPWEHEHTEGPDAHTGSAYFPPNDFNEGKGGYVCHHSHCKDKRSINDLVNWAGINTTESEGKEESDTTTKQIISLIVKNADLFHTPQDEGYATFEQNGAKQTWGLMSSGFKEWLSNKVYRELEGFVLSETLLKNCISTLKGIAKYDGEEIEVFKRCAPHKTGYVIDLTNEKWEVVVVGPKGWRIVNESPVKFIRSNNSAPLPAPISGGDPFLWFKYLNVKPADQTLILADALDQWRPDTPYSVLCWIGEHGSGKSTSHTCYRQLTDPNTVPLRAAPKSVGDLFVSAGANHQASFENMSNLSTTMQDALCTLSTGGGFSKRKLYSDSEESTIEIKRKVVINAIEDVVTRPDLIDRAIRIEVPVLSQIADERDFKQEFEADSPVILGGMLDLFVKALAVLPTVELSAPTRMIGFAKLGEAVHQVLGIDKSFLEIYTTNKNESMTTTIDSSPAALSVMEFLHTSGGPYEGNIKNLLEILEEGYQQAGDGWPKSPRGLGSILKRMAPALRSQGVQMRPLGRKRDGRHVKIWLDR